MEITKHIVNGSLINFKELINSYKNKWAIRYRLPNSVEFFEAQVIGEPDEEMIRTLVIEYINSVCDKEILCNHKHNGDIVWLDMENQRNYESAWNKLKFDKHDGLKYGIDTPKRVFKISDSFVEFQTFEELDNFCNSCFEHIENTLTKFWAIKQGIDWSVYDTE